MKRWIMVRGERWIMDGVGERSWAKERQIRGGGDGSWVEGEMDHG
jgi:hypothetical protein